MIKYGVPQKDRTTFGGSEFGTMHQEMVKGVCTKFELTSLKRKALGSGGRMFM